MKVKNIYVIYRVLNQINGKIYIGRTTRGIDVRWDSHKNGLNAKKNINLRLYRAFNKYGFENFRIFAIDYAETFKELKEKEGQWIIKEKSYLPEIGYNMAIETEGGLEFFDEESKDRRRVSIHKVQSEKNIGEYGKGVRRYDLTFYASLTYKKKNYNLPCESQEAAKICRDKLAIYFYGKDASLNYPENIYSDEEILSNYKLFEEIQNKLKSSKYRGVSKGRKGFSAIVSKSKRTYFLGFYKKEKDAAFVVDKARFYLNKGEIKNINFLERVPEYSSSLDKLESWFNEITKNKSINPLSLKTNEELIGMAILSKGARELSKKLPKVYAEIKNRPGLMSQVKFPYKLKKEEENKKLLDSLSDKIAKCSNIGDFSKKYKKEYSFIRSKNIYYILDSLREKSPLSNEEIISICKSFKTVKELKEKNLHIYDLIRNRGIYNEATLHMDGKSRPYKNNSDEELFEFSASYRTRTEVFRGNRQLWNEIYRRNKKWINDLWPKGNGYRRKTEIN